LPNDRYTSNSRNACGRIWIAIRFIVFGVGGFIALWISWLSLIFAFDPPSQRLFSPFVAVPLALVGALMMLYGGGQWGRWAYLWVFVSVPIVITLLGMLSGVYLALDFVFAKPLLLVGIPLPMVVSYLLVRRYYRLQDRQKLRQQS
jgi:hypothetical protein